MLGKGFLKNCFRYHAPDENKVKCHEFMRDACRNLAEVINRVCPECRERDIAVMKVEEAMMWANAGIARHEAEGIFQLRQELGGTIECERSAE
jgi:hypothetical protein